MEHIGISRKTLEDYERRGYIHPARSPSSNYKEYTLEDIETVWNIKQLITIGYTHKEIGQMMLPGIDPGYKQSLHEKIRKMEKQISRLEKLIERAREMEASGILPALPVPEQELS